MIVVSDHQRYGAYAMLYAYSAAIGNGEKLTPEEADKVLAAWFMAAGVRDEAELLGLGDAEITAYYREVKQAIERATALDTRTEKTPKNPH